MERPALQAHHVSAQTGRRLAGMAWSRWRRERQMEAAPSRTAMLAAVARGLLRLEMPPPWVLDDPFALVLAGPAWRDLHELASSLFPAQVFAETAAAVCTRSRYAEDRLAAGGFTQYVILGAG